MGTCRPRIGEYRIGLSGSLVSREYRDATKRDSSNLGHARNIPFCKGHKAFRPGIELFNSLVDARVDFDELFEPGGDDLVNLGVYPWFLPPALTQAGLHDFMEHVSPHKCWGGLAGGADEAGYEGLAATLRCIGESGRGNEEVGVEDEEMGFSGDSDGGGGGQGDKDINGVTWADRGARPIVTEVGCAAFRGGGNFYGVSGKRT